MHENRTERSLCRLRPCFSRIYFAKVFTFFHSTQEKYSHRPSVPTSKATKWNEFYFEVKQIYLSILVCETVWDCAVAWARLEGSCIHTFSLISEIWIINVKRERKHNKESFSIHVPEVKEKTRFIVFFKTSLNIKKKNVFSFCFIKRVKQEFKVNLLSSKRWRLSLFSNENYLGDTLITKLKRGSRF